MAAPILDALPDAGLVLDEEGRVALANGAARARFGDWIVGRSYVGALRAPAILSTVEDGYVRREGGEATLTHVADGVETRLLLTVRPIMLSEGPMPHLVLVFRDDSAASAREAIQSEFVANVSHELKTPLTSILGFIETLEGPARTDPKAAGRFLATMRAEAERMSRLVSDLLSLSRVEAQARRRPTDRVDLSHVAGEVIATLAERLDVAADLAPGAWVAGDADQLAQVVTNLLENAARYGGGRAEVRVEAVARAAALRGPAWRLTVRDHGPGIAPEHLPRLTERFYRADAHRSRAAGGTGLGLAIVKHVVQRHRGRLRIESPAGEGTIVTVTLPRLAD